MIDEKLPTRIILYINDSEKKQFTPLIVLGKRCAAIECHFYHPGRLYATFQRIADNRSHARAVAIHINVYVELRRKQFVRG